jgi:hypothetical protein
MLDELDDQISRGLAGYWAMEVRSCRATLLPVFLCWSLVWGGSWLIRSTHKSEALILVEQQKVPEQYVVPTLLVAGEGVMPIRASKQGFERLDNPKLVGMVLNEASDFDRTNHADQYYALNGPARNIRPVKQ